MRVIYGAESNYNFTRSTGVGLGNFDGLHVGHNGFDRQVNKGIGVQFFGFGCVHL